MPKPDWLKVKIPGGKEYSEVSSLLKSLSLNTVCIHAKCPNISECYNNKTATFMILGDTCTRNCKYCNITKGSPKEPDQKEPKNIAIAVKKLNLKHVVITCVTRDDLKDGGAYHFAKTILSIRKENPDTVIEVLTSDFDGNKESLRTVLLARPDIFSHNIEACKKIFSTVRPMASYERSLDMLRYAKKNSSLTTKSGLMVGLGETTQDIKDTLKDLRKNDVDALTIGQYLQPSKKHIKVSKYYTPDEFKELKEYALNKGFMHIESGPLVRSSYHAEKINIRQ